MVAGLAVSYLSCVGTYVELLAGAGSGGCPSHQSRKKKMMTSTLKPAAAHNNTSSRRFKHRSGGCTRPVSTVRPVSSSFPAFFQSPDSDPKGFVLFGGRENLEAIDFLRKSLEI